MRVTRSLAPLAPKTSSVVKSVPRYEKFGVPTWADLRRSLQVPLQPISTRVGETVPQRRVTGHLADEEFVALLYSRGLWPTQKAA